MSNKKIKYLAELENLHPEEYQVFLYILSVATNISNHVLKPPRIPTDSEQKALEIIKNNWLLIIYWIAFVRFGCFKQSAKPLRDSRVLAPFGEYYSVLLDTCNFIYNEFNYLPIIDKINGISTNINEQIESPLDWWALIVTEDIELRQIILLEKSYDKKDMNKTRSKDKEKKLLKEMKDVSQENFDNLISRKKADLEGELIRKIMNYCHDPYINREKQKKATLQYKKLVTAYQYYVKNLDSRDIFAMFPSYGDIYITSWGGNKQKKL